MKKNIKISIILISIIFLIILAWAPWMNSISKKTYGRSLTYDVYRGITGTKYIFIDIGEKNIKQNPYEIFIYENKINVSWIPFGRHVETIADFKRSEELGDIKCKISVNFLFWTSPYTDFLAETDCFDI